MEASEPGRQEPVSPIGAVEEPPPEYAGTVASSVTSCYGLSVASLLRKLQRFFTNMRNTETMGEKEITYKQKEMSQITDKTRTKSDSADELEPGFLATIQSALDQSNDLSEQAIRRLDKLSTEEKEAKALVSERPKLAFETFTGDVSQYPNFLANQEVLYKKNYDPNAPDKGASQQLFQLSKILAPDLARTVLSFSGAKNSAQKAAEWLSLKFDSPQLMIPVIYHELKDILPARNKIEVPQVADQVESLSALTINDHTTLPSDIIQAVFRGLYLSQEERKKRCSPTLDKKLKQLFW